MRFLAAVGIAICLAACQPHPRRIAADPIPEISETALERKFAPDIVLMETLVPDSPLVRDGIVFTGSSSITRWDSLASDMAPLPVVNRGFGGSGIRQVSYYAPRIVLPLRPKVIVFYCGENDICTPDGDATQPLRDFKDFTALVRASLPETRIVYVSMKPSPLRWQYWEKFKKANALVQDFVEEERGMRYVDVSSAMLDSTGRPHRGIWMPDSLHLNAEGYAIWRAILKPVAEEEFEKANGTFER